MQVSCSTALRGRRWWKAGGGRQEGKTGGRRGEGVEREKGEVGSGRWKEGGGG